MSENERRSAKLLKQVEVEDDGDEDDSVYKCENTPQPSSPGPLRRGVPTPTIQSASSSSGTSPDETMPKTVPPPITRKQTLIRTPALEGTSPPPESFFSHIKPNGAVTSDSHLLANGTAEKGFKKKGQSLSHEAKEYLLTSHKVSNDSGHGTLDNNDGSSDTSVLSRDSSLENASNDCYKDSSGVNIPKFIRDTLMKGPKDKKTVLAIEAQLLDFINSDCQNSLKTNEMTSYDRMIVHRLSAYLGLDHNVDPTGKSVVVNKTDKTRSVRLTDIILEDSNEEPKKKILKKPASLDEKHSRHNSKAAFGSNRAKSLEERQQIYSEARERIFKGDENMPEGGNNGSSSHLTANYMPQITQQRSLDSMRSMSAKWNSQESGYGMENSLLRGARLRANMTKSHSYGGTVPTATSPQQTIHMPHTVSLLKADSLKDSPNAHYGGTQNLSYPCPMPVLSSDQIHLTRSTPDAGPSPLSHNAQQCPTSYAYLVSSDYSSIPVGSLIINPHTMWLSTQSYQHSYEACTYVQPHVNADGSLYRFDPSCPPPFMGPSQPPPPTPPAGIYQSISSENVNEMTARFASTSLTPVETGTEAYTVGVQGQPVPLIPTILPHPHSLYTSPHPPQFTQGQYYTSPSPATGQQSVRYVAYPVHPQAQQQILQATPVEGQGQTTVPMPAVGLPTMPGAGGYQVIGAPYQNAAIATGPAPQCVDLTSAYHYATTPETVVVSTAGGVSGSPVTMTTPGGLIQTFNIAYPGQQPHQHPIAHSHQSQFNPGSATPTGTTYYAVPVSTPTPSQSLAQPPPPSHQFQQHPQTVYYTPSNMTVAPLTYPVAVSNPSQSSTSTYKSIPTSYLANHFRSSTPPQQQQQLQPVAAPSSNGHHTTQLTLNYAQPINFTPGQAITTPQGTQLLTFQHSPYQVRPMGAVIQLAGNPAVSGPQPQMNYQFYRPGNISDLKMMTPGAIQRQPSITLNPQQPRPKGNTISRQPKKGQKKLSREQEDYPMCQQNVSMMTPIIPGLTAQPYQMPSTSNRQ
ncbi:unnamed protein product [Lymnaea stagnalis]|uniref:Uncharacterized protein n=1 Tax=Lymnaea stagnalis TaxID=6523 RepID=A0AAV2HIR7_LYMST